MFDRGMEFGKLGLKLFIDQQKRLQRPANIAIAPGYDLVDRGLMKSGTHRKASKYSPHDNCVGIHGLLWIMWKGRTCENPPIRRSVGSKSAALAYRKPPVTAV
jgi:hypothetical protein